MKITLSPPNLTQEQEELIKESKKPKQNKLKSFKKKYKKKGDRSSGKPQGLTKKKLLKVPKVKPIKSLNAVSSAMKGGANTRFVSKGKQGFMNFDDEYEKEKTGFLGGYSL